MAIKHFKRKLPVLIERFFIRLRVTYLIWRVSMSKKKPTRLDDSYKVYLTLVHGDASEIKQPYVNPMMR
jgi:hypothetical protein